MDDPTMRSDLTRRLHQRAVVHGTIALPAVPGMLEEYLTMCDNVFRGVGVHFTEEQLDQLRDALARQLAVAFEASSRSSIVITYDSPQGLTVNYFVKAEWSSIEDAYDAWKATREPPLFGTEPDARVLSLAVAAGDPAACPVLDLGAGTGRNALTLARRGHPVDAVEMAPGFAEGIALEAERESLSVRVLTRDIFAAADDLRRDYGLIVLSEVASDFRTVDQLRRVFELAAQRLAPGGRLVMNAFLPRDDYIPDASARELGQQCYTSIFTREEFDAAAAGLPVSLESDDSVYDFERSHLPPAAWPPTSWYERWISGQDVFDVEREASPIEMRWLVYARGD